jgi:transcriptional antiterminator RfaH
MAKQWFLLQFKPNAHIIAEKNLNRQGFETFLPLYTSNIHKTFGYKNITKPLFSGYMFVAFDRENAQWGKINNTYGVSRLITFNSVLKSVPDDLVNDLMNKYEASCNLQPKKQFIKGNQVKISSGPFANFIATIEAVDVDQRVLILMDLMGAKAKIKIHSSNLHVSN